MKNKVIIGIHGLGNKPAKRVLTNWWKKSMMEGLAHIDTDIILPKIEMVYWADVFNEHPLKIRKVAEDHPLRLHEIYTKSPKNFIVDDISTRRRFMDFLGKQMNEIFLDDDLTLNYSFISDMIITRYFRELSAYYHEICHDKNNIECIARDLIRSRTAKVLNKYRNHEIFLIGHSMGSIIAFDVMSFLLPDIRIHTFATMGSPLGLPIIVSKIAAEQRLKGEEKIVMKTPPGVTNRWANFSDLLDKIAFNYMLSDDFSANAHGVAPQDFIVINDYMVKDEKNPHKSFGYLRTPEFAQELHSFIKS